MSDDEETIKDEHVTVWENKKKDKDRERIRNALEESKHTNEAEGKEINRRRMSEEIPKKVVGYAGDEGTQIPITTEIEKAHTKTTPNVPTEQDNETVSPVTGAKELKPLKPVGEKEKKPKPIGRENENEVEADVRKRTTYNQEAPPEKLDPVLQQLAQYANRPDVFEQQVNAIRDQVLAVKKKQKAAKERGIPFNFGAFQERGVEGAENLLPDDKKEQRYQKKHEVATENNRRRQITEDLHQLTRKVMELDEKGGFGEGNPEEKESVISHNDKGEPVFDEKILQQQTNWREFDDLLRRMNQERQAKEENTKTKASPTNKKEEREEGGRKTSKLPTLRSEDEGMPLKLYDRVPKVRINELGESVEDEVNRKRSSKPTKKEIEATYKKKAEKTKTKPHTFEEAKGAHTTHPDEESQKVGVLGAKPKREELKIGDKYDNPSVSEVKETVKRTGKGKDKGKINIQHGKHDLMGSNPETGKPTGVLHDTRMEYKHPGAYESENEMAEDPNGERYNVPKLREGFEHNWIAHKDKETQAVTYTWGGIKESKPNKGTKISNEEELAEAQMELDPDYDWKAARQKLEAERTEEAMLQSSINDLDELARTGKIQEVKFSSKSLEERRKGKFDADYVKRQIAEGEKTAIANKPPEKKFDEKGKQVFAPLKENEIGKPKAHPAKLPPKMLEHYNQTGTLIQELKEYSEKHDMRFASEDLDKVLVAYLDGDFDKALKLFDTASKEQIKFSGGKQKLLRGDLRRLGFHLQTLTHDVHNEVSPIKPQNYKSKLAEIPENATAEQKRKIRDDISRQRTKIHETPKIKEREKEEVGGIFNSLADKYELMWRVYDSDRKQDKELVAHMDGQELERKRMIAKVIREFDKQGRLPTHYKYTGADKDLVTELFAEVDRRLGGKKK
jgi:hypothetical protein